MSPADPATRATPDAGTPLSAGRTPVAAPAAAPVAVVLAIALLALGVLAVRDALVSAGALGGSTVTDALARQVDGTGPAVWMLPVGVVVALLGLVLVVLALAPRRRTEVQLRADAAVWVRPADVARFAARTTEDVPGVLSVTATATRRKVSITARTTALDTTEVRAAIAAAVAQRLEPLSSAPRISVTARSAGGSR